MIGWLVGKLVLRGLSERVARPLAMLLAAGVLIALLCAAAGLWLRFHDKRVVTDERARVEALGAEGRETAAEEAVADAIEQVKQERRYDDAITNARDTGRPSAAGVALGCERLRRAGIAAPPECGPGSGDRGEAASHR